jgi:hypothetical protein
MERLAQPRAAGESGRCHARQDVEALGRAGNRFCDQLAGKRGQDRALAGIAMGEEQAALAADMRQPGRRDRDLPAPAVIDPALLQRREDARQIRPDECGDVLGRTRPIEFAAAEDQALVGAQPEIIDDEAAVGNGPVRGMGEVASGSVATT